jgi:RNA polymerase sigma factor (sigma-70 family)
MPAHEPSDEELYRRWHSGDPPGARQAAWEELEGRYAQRLYGFFALRLRNTDAAQDAVREVFLRLMADARAIESFPAYLWKTAYTTLCDTIRRIRPPDGSRLALLAHNPPTDPAATAAQAELHAALIECLNALPADQREFVLLHACAGLTFAHAATAVGWTVSIPTSKYRFDNNLRELAACLKESGFSF